jgi:hypothetical protein
LFIFPDGRLKLRSYSGTAAGTLGVREGIRENTGD